MSISRLSRLFFFLGVALLLAPASGVAGLIVNENGTWPAAPVVETFARTDGNVNSERDARFNRDLTQTFQVSAPFQLDKVYIDYEEALPDKEITIRLFTVADVNAADPIIDPDNPGFTGAILFSQMHTTSSGINTGDGGNNPFLVMEFDLTGADEVMLAANTGSEGYAFQIVRTGLGSDSDVGTERAFKWHYNSADQNFYTAGRAYAIGGGPGALDDWLFAVQAVPEPGALAMGLFGAVGALLTVRRRTL